MQSAQNTKLTVGLILAKWAISVEHRLIKARGDDFIWAAHEH